MAKPILHRLDHVSDANICQALYDCSKNFPASCTQIVMQVAKNHGFQKPDKYDLNSLCPQMGFRTRKLFDAGLVTRFQQKQGGFIYLASDTGRKLMDG